MQKPEQVLFCPAASLSENNLYDVTENLGTLCCLISISGLGPLEQTLRREFPHEFTDENLRPEIYREMKIVRRGRSLWTFDQLRAKDSKEDGTLESSGERFGPWSNAEEDDQRVPGSDDSLSSCQKEDTLEMTRHISSYYKQLNAILGLKADQRMHILSMSQKLIC